MLANGLTTYEYWDLKKVSIPSRSRLYQLEPIGIGTPLVESLTGYISRLAEAHCVTPKALISKELVSFIPKTYKTTNLFEMRSLTGAVNGIGTMAFDLVTVLESLTLHSDLRFLTLLTWADIFPQRKLLRSKRAWCPYCYEEWYSTKNKVIYEPLIWFFEAVTACHCHNKFLCQQCPYCQRDVPPLASYSRPGYCPYCLEWLGMTVNYPTTDKTQASKEEMIWQTWVIKTLGELLATSPRLSQPLSREIVAQAFCRYVQQFSEGNTSAFARMLKIPKNKVWMWQMGKVLPELNVILKICFTLQVSVLDFLTQETVKVNSQHCPSIPQKQVLDSSANKLEVKFDLRRTQHLLENVLQTNEQPLPMTAVAKSLGYPKRVLYRHFPELCRAISAKYVNYMKESRIKRIEYCCEEVKQAVRQVHTEGIYPSEAAISRLLAKPGCFRDREVRAALRTARKEIGLEP
ncbi:TniQ family protein [Anabaena subtropica]|uniref:TniQ family protein n=1 Tax=Anabaena subtropica FACHB-260 TaxID=2692884 RepID=A0ABR8CQT7_9NOST|nr:TniQ family protein [Anabaena subtropica]MBD2345546.1 TniQ family protein [Anabaena subtropica FACHB-260]